jgi:(E)-4-hydroxy-3-methylbut-2-enyl-diphosphate synthase
MMLDRSQQPYLTVPYPRRASVAVDVGGVIVGGGAPVVVQSMTNTDTADIDATVAQVAPRWRRPDRRSSASPSIATRAAAAVPRIRDRLRQARHHVPLVGDFPLYRPQAAADHPDCGRRWPSIASIPAMSASRTKRDTQFATIIETGDPLRQAGAHRGQLGLARSGAADPVDGRELGLGSPCRRPAVTARGDRPVGAALGGTGREIGLPRNRIILSAKVSQVQDLIAVYPGSRRAANHALHLGLTEAGMGSKGIVASSAAMGIVLQQGIGDTIRVSLTPGAERRPDPRGAGRAGTAADHGLPAVPAGGGGLPRLRPHHEPDRVPGAGPGNPGSSSAQHARVWKEKYPGVETLSVAVMGCIVNGPGEASMPISGSPCPAPAKPRPRRSSSTGRRQRPCAAPTIAEAVQGDRRRLYREALRHGSED